MDTVLLSYKTYDDENETEKAFSNIESAQQHLKGVEDFCEWWCISNEEGEIVASS